MTKKSFFIFLLVATFQLSYAQTVVLKGKVFDNSKNLMLLEAHEDARDSNIKIPLSADSTFEYQVTNPEDLAYQLILENEFRAGVFNSQIFFTDNDTITFNLYPRKDFSKNLVIGSAKTKDLTDFKNKVDNLFKQRVIEIKMEIDSLLKNNQKDSEEFKNLLSKMDYLQAEYWEKNFQEIEVSPSIPKYSILVEMTKRALKTPFLSRDRLFGVAKLYKETYPEHLYTETLAKELEVLTFKTGTSFPEIKMTRLSGETDSLSAYVQKDKIVILHLWTPWCGPCIKKGKELAYFYKEYNDKGLEVIGVLGGIKTPNDGQKTLEKYPSPWKTFLEVNSANNIWNKYGLGQSGGGVFVINKSGQIINAEGSIGEIKDILKKELP